jgi:hypothetical protein
MFMIRSSVAIPLIPGKSRSHSGINWNRPIRGHSRNEYSNSTHSTPGIFPNIPRNDYSACYYDRKVQKLNDTMQHSLD